MALALVLFWPVGRLASFDLVQLAVLDFLLFEPFWKPVIDWLAMGWFCSVAGLSFFDEPTTHHNS